MSASEFGSTHTRSVAAPAPATAGFASAPVQSLAEKQAEAEALAAQLARVAAGEEVGICESCQG